jgi:predicted aspartyl protease
MMTGHWRDGFPRVTLVLPGLQRPLEVEFIVDTGFEGGLTLPESLIAHLDVSVQERRAIKLAGGLRQRCYSYEFVLEWEEERQVVEVLTLEGSPLLGNDIWKEHSLQAENMDGGEVFFEPL